MHMICRLRPSYRNRFTTNQSPHPALQRSLLPPQESFLPSPRRLPRRLPAAPTPLVVSIRWNRHRRRHHLLHRRPPVHAQPQRSMQPSASAPALLPQPRSSPRALAPLSPLAANKVLLRQGSEVLRAPSPAGERARAHTHQGRRAEPKVDVSAILAASRAQATKSSIPAAHAMPKTMFIVEAASSAASSSKSTVAGLVSPSRGKALKEAVAATKRDEEAKFAGLLTPTKGQRAQMLLDSTFSPPASVAHSSFGAPVHQMARLLPPPHRPSPVKALLQGSGTSTHMHVQTTVPALAPAVVSIAKLRSP